MGGGANIKTLSPQDRLAYEERQQDMIQQLFGGQQRAAPPAIEQAGLEGEPSILLQSVLTGQEKAMGGDPPIGDRPMYQAPERRSLASLINRPRPVQPGLTGMAPGGRPGGL